MIQQITKGIKISVETSFEGMFYKQNAVQYAFGYTIIIENQGNDVVQLKSRFWEIKDVLNEIETVSGEGVVGKKPIIHPGEKYTYQSGCLLSGPFGAMKGHYKMQNLNSDSSLIIKIPSFKLSATYALN